MTTFLRTRGVATSTTAACTPSLRRSPSWSGVSVVMGHWHSIDDWGTEKGTGYFSESSLSPFLLLHKGGLPMAQMTAVQISRPGGPFEGVEREVPGPGPNQVRLKVQACGICHSDMFVKEGHWPGLQYPRVTGHEVAGVIDEVGAGATAWKKGQRVGVGWHGWHCGHCDPCRRGDFINCRNLRITGFSDDGGYAPDIVANVDAFAVIPYSLSPAEAAPIPCAGITTFNSLRHSGAGAGDLVAVLGLGGLGHLGVQFASKMGFRTVAIGRGKDKEPLA